MVKIENGVPPLSQAVQTPFGRFQQDVSGWYRELTPGKFVPVAPNERELLAQVGEFPGVAPGGLPAPAPYSPGGTVARPNFRAHVYHDAERRAGREGKARPAGKGLRDADRAVPHRFSWKDMRDRTRRFLDGKESVEDFYRWTDRMFAATAAYAKRYASDPSTQDLADSFWASLSATKSARRALVDGRAFPVVVPDLERQFLAELNSLSANVPDEGPHRKVNNPVRERRHMNWDAHGLTPMSRAAASMTPPRVSGFATTGDHLSLVGTSGATLPIASLPPHERDLISGNESPVPHW